MYSEYIIIFLLILVIILVIFIVFTRKSIERRAHRLFDAWKSKEQERWHAWIGEEAEARAKIQAESMVREWQNKEEPRIRQDAVRRSQSVIRGKMTEHLVPWFSDFRYDPSDARFLGSPVDFIVFNGLSEGDLKELVIVEVKTGSSLLSSRERAVARIIEEGRVRFEILRKE